MIPKNLKLSDLPYFTTVFPLITKGGEISVVKYMAIQVSHLSVSYSIAANLRLPSLVDFSN